MIFNLNSAFFVASCMYCLILIILFNIWLNNKSEFKGLNDFIIAYLCLSLSSIINIFRPECPSVISLIVQNTLGVGFFLFTLRGLCSLFNIKIKLYSEYTLFVVTVIILIIFSAITPNFIVRSYYLFSVAIYYNIRLLFRLPKIGNKKLLFWKVSLFIFCSIFIITFAIRIIMLFKIQPLFFNMNINMINAIMWASIFTSYAGIGFYFISVITYIQKSKLTDLVTQKDAILRESHHRIKNNLNLLINLIKLKRISSDNFQTDFDDLQNDLINRINSVTHIHDILYKDSDLSTISVKLYLDKLVKSITQTILPIDSKIKISLKIEDIQLNSDLCLSIGLIINELVTNSIKYAFENILSGTIILSLTFNENMISINYSDNGRGFSCDEEELNSFDNFGLKLINSLSKQLNANHTIDTSNGCTYDFQIPLNQQEPIN